MAPIRAAPSRHVTLLDNPAPTLFIGGRWRKSAICHALFPGAARDDEPPLAVALDSSTAGEEEDGKWAKKKAAWFRILVFV